MKIDLAFSPHELARKEQRNQTVVVIDVLRATSTMIVAFENGCSSFIPVSTPDEARKLSTLQKNSGLLLGGERKAMPIPGFLLGNSPYEYCREKVQGKTIILTTTNGTQALMAAGSAAEVFIGAFLNISALCQRIGEANRDVLIVCSGEKDLFCLEDAVCGGAVIDRLEQARVPVSESDAAMAAKLLYECHKNDIQGMLCQCEWGQYLGRIGLGRDVTICAQLDFSSMVPVYREGKVFLDR